jgi:hypothetical protein
MNDCLPVFNPGDMEVMRKRITLMIMKNSCGVIEDPVSTLIITRQNHCDDHMLLYQALKQSSNGSVNNNATNQKRSSVIIPTKNMKRLQHALDDRFLNDGDTVICPIGGCIGLQALKIGVEKMPAILVIEPTAEVDEGNKMPLCCISDIESNLTVQGTPYELVQVMLHNGSHYRGLTLLGNQNVLYDGKYCNEFKSIAKMEKFASEGIGGNYRLSCLWYRKVLNKQGLSSYSLPVYPPFTAHDRINEEETCETKTPQHSKEATMEPDTIKEEATCQTKTPTNQKRMSKPKKRYTPPDQSTPKPPKGRSRKKQQEKISHQP